MDELAELLDDVAARDDVADPAVLVRAADMVDQSFVADFVTSGEPRCIVAEHPKGPALALRHYEPGYVSTVHDHGWALLLGLRGSGSLERWRRGGRGVQFVGAVPTTPRAPNVVHPREPHRQVVGRDGALELVLVGDVASVADRTDHEAPVGELAAADVFEAFVDAWARADIAALEALYAPDVFADLHVPRWQVQLEGRRQVLDLISREEFLPGFRLERWSARATGDGFVLEVEPHFAPDGKHGMAQMVLLIRTRDDLVCEHTVYCTGIWDQATMDGLVASGGLLRP